MTTLITAAEAVRHAPVNADFPTAKLCNQIPAEEINLFVDHIGYDFYERLLADLVDYSGVDAWDSGDTYAEGDLVMQEGIVYESLADGNTEPIGDPLNLSAWKEADKFTTTCFNSLWVDGFLREVLAFTVVAAVLPHVTYPTGSIGTVEKYEDNTGVKTVSNPNYSKVVGELQRGKAIRLKLLAKYMSDHSTGCDYSGALYGAACENVNVNPGRTRKTFYRY
jgi:hypothetical protein